MPLGDLLSEVLRLQADYTSDPKSPLMLRRKQLVEREIPEWIASVLDPVFPPWRAGGSNGKGNPAEVPWSRYFDPASSPAPTDGWYAVYLFDAVGQSVYLSLNQGTTTWDVDKQDFVYRPKNQLLRRVQWAREALSATDSGPKTFDDIDLKGRQRLGRVYQFGNVHGIEYRLDAIPSDEELRNDLLHIGRLLEKLYEIDANTAYIPGDEPPEILDAELASANAAGNTRRRSKGQGFRLNRAEQTAIERHAVKLATEYFKGLKYKVKDTGSTESYDLEATRGDEKVYIEVKGTTSPGEQIILTRKEVEHHNQHPNNALVVVHSILLDRTQQPPVAYGGTRVVTQPWKIDPAGLTVISYRYKIPPA
ncbi:MrcB family domain-containing protein [Nocardia sp. NPDC059691]|uniref:MrcB family domain-containing protein n=1 Tax=Nocardia sp. NPDC059691 TaxID=3346908 RepID=UPI0036BAD269